MLRKEAFGCQTADREEWQGTADNITRARLLLWHCAPAKRLVGFRGWSFTNGNKVNGSARLCEWLDVAAAKSRYTESTTGAPWATQ